MPTEDFIKPGFVTPQMAAALQTGFGASMAANDELMNRARDMPEEFLPVKLTASDGGTPALYSWTLQYKDTTNLRVDHPNGRTGTPTNNPAYFPVGTISTFPFECWIKRFGWDSTKGGATYEVISTPLGSTTVGCRAYNSANISLPASVNTKITFDSEDYDTGTFHDTSTHADRFAPATTGFYLFGAHAWFSDLTAIESGQITILENDLTNLTVSSLNGPGYITVSVLWKCLIVGDFISSLASHSSASTRTITKLTAFSPNGWIVKIG